MDWKALAAAHPALAGLPVALREAAAPHEFHAGETLFRQGGRPTHMHCVLTGEVRLVRRSRGGAESILQRSRGGFFAEASLESAAYHCDAVAAEAGVVLRIALPLFRAVLEEDARFRKAWMAQLAGEVRRLRARCERLSLHGAAERIRHYLETEGTDGAVVLTQSKKAWAAELGLTHEALYRALKRLQEEGAIRVAGECIALRAAATRPGRKASASPRRR